MIQLDIKADIRKAERFLTNLRKNAMKKAAARAINDTLVTLRAEGSREIKAKHPALKIGDIKRKILTKRAYYLNLRGSINTNGAPLSMLLFNPSGGTRTKRGRVTPLRARIGQTRSVIEYQGRKAFRIGAFKNEVFVRRSAKGRRVRSLRGPSMPGVFRAQNDRMMVIATKRWGVAFQNRLRYEIEQSKA